MLDQDGVLGSIVALPAPPITASSGRYESDALAYAETAEQVLAACLAQAGTPPPLGLCSQLCNFAACLPDPLRNDLGLRFSQPVEHLAPRQIAALLLEGIIFRVARILEEFHREHALERVYLSGGLSELSCLQQGIAQCVPFEVYRLLQKDASLRDAALLAAGMAPACRREAEKIKTAGSGKSLPEKYLRWKSWLDTLLGVKAA